ncbi:hypothetical protein BJY01DRAFT_210006 [Aspergillus pseudoustus]|uniref:Uncharacterized protein n=1 Tax=Aspergillus pseudoustus TaxID=1810923 RepID=A0ABR4KDE7_9EURO
MGPSHSVTRSIYIPVGGYTSSRISDAHPHCCFACSLRNRGHPQREYRDVIDTG